MKRSVTCSGTILASAALIALGVGCSHESPPAQVPPAGTTSPTFESNVPTTPAPTPHPEMGAPAPLPPPAATAPPPPGEMVAPPSTPQEPPAGATGGAEDERQMCDALAGAAVLHVEDVQNGAAIVMTPKPGHDLASVRDEARRVETTLHQRGGVETAPAPGSSCGLFSVTQMPGVTAQLVEGAKRVRIVLTTPNPAEVKDLRRVTRDQVQSLGKAHPR